MSLESVPADYEELDDNVMSNCDHEIEDWAEEKLKTEKVYGEYPAWNFYGLVWWDGKKFKCMIKQYGIHVDTIEGKTLKKIMKKASDKYGYR